MKNGYQPFQKKDITHFRHRSLTQCSMVLCDHSFFEARRDWTQSLTVSFPRIDHTTTVGRNVLPLKTMTMRAVYDKTFKTLKKTFKRSYMYEKGEICFFLRKNTLSIFKFLYQYLVGINDDVLRGHE